MAIATSTGNNTTNAAADTATSTNLRIRTLRTEIHACC
jgi:hypothetical protein